MNFLPISKEKKAYEIAHSYVHKLEMFFSFPGQHFSHLVANSKKAGSHRQTLSMVKFYYSLAVNPGDTHI